MGCAVSMACGSRRGGMKPPISTVSRGCMLCERRNPSRFTMTGSRTDSCSAMRNAIRVAS
ncbi:MAG: hypothetical protein A4E40_00584 [Methanoregulaceae archaeon PtaU1.Bin059]|nr:MAG: hypothetical protein A4E40_00584 [Methanoregulaceae archaeon PtaU1.Bin059]